ncbi:uncharacterized protein [Lepeophtheirus salmonis]|nr:uncharacterized protein LOC121126537 [Lepeophtheirus salmonis]
MKNPWILLLILWRQLELVCGGCPFQNPFWFVEKPTVVTVYDENGEMIPNKARVMWGRMENFRCVDYFQVEYFQKQDPQGTVRLTPKINRHRRSFEIDVIPCTDYYFKVIASEDWKGMREDFKMNSEVVYFKLAYTPRFINRPTVKEKRRGQYKSPGRGGAPPPSDSPEPTLEEEYSIKVFWRLTDVDYPICLDYFELKLYDNSYNETVLTRNFPRPFSRPRFEFVVSNKDAPCDLDYLFMLKAYGYNRLYSTTDWTPPSCVVTTPAPTTTTETSPTSTVAGETTPGLGQQLEEVLAENERLTVKINGLKQEYEKIGLQVYLSFKEDFFKGLQDFLASRHSGNTAGLVPISGNQSEPLFG